MQTPHSARAACSSFGSIIAAAEMIDNAITRKTPLLNTVTLR
jgi:hypothetical protein